MGGLPVCDAVILQRPSVPFPALKRGVVYGVGVYLRMALLLHPKGSGVLLPAASFIL